MIVDKMIARPVPELKAVHVTLVASLLQSQKRLEAN